MTPQLGNLVYLPQVEKVNNNKQKTKIYYDADHEK